MRRKLGLDATTPPALNYFLDENMLRLPSPDWSRGMFTHENGEPGSWSDYGEPGSWSDSHAWSKGLGGDGAFSLATMGVGSLVGLADDAARHSASVGKATNQSVLDKLGRYLLNDSHPIGGSKSKWFREALGFTKDNIDDLAKQIQFDPNIAKKTQLTDFGQKFTHRTSIIGTNGRTIDVDFVWIIGDDNVPKLVTAVPTKK